jgi:signal transduction histidine kinase
VAHVSSGSARADRPLAQAALVRQVLEPLWRGLVGYRLLALGYAAALLAVNIPRYRAPALGVAVLVGMAVWTALTSVGYLRPEWVRLSPRRLAGLDLVVTLAALASTPLVETPERIAAGAPVVPTVWVAGAAVALALARGVLAGLAGALLVQGAVLLVRGRLGPAEVTDLLLMVAVTLAVGYAATVLRRSSDRLREAIELRAAVAERERLARSIHDEVLQVLAQVRRRGAELGGPAAELGVLAGEQEIALRNLVTAGPPVEQPRGQLDLAAGLAALASPTVSVATPADAVPLPAHTVAEVLAAARAVLANVRMHVGPGAPAWVLVEDLGDQVVVSVRDDGLGIPEGRLAAAEAEGRMGIARSIRGRIAAIGGTATCVTGPGVGCEWTFDLPRAPAGGRG